MIVVVEDYFNILPSKNCFLRDFLKAETSLFIRKKLLGVRIESCYVVCGLSKSVRISNICQENAQLLCKGTSVTISGDLLDFGQLLKAFGNN